MLLRNARCGAFLARERFCGSLSPVTIKVAHAPRAATRIIFTGKRLIVADTKKITDTAERKKVKRAARKKAAPKAKRTTPRGANKKKVKKLVRGQSKR